MNRKHRILCGAGAFVLIGLAIYLFNGAIGLTSRDEAVEIKCASIVRTGGAQRFLAEDTSSRSYTYEVERGRLEDKDPEPNAGPWVVEDRMEAKCDQARTTQLGWIAFLLAPAAVLTTLSLIPGRGGWQENA